MGKALTAVKVGRVKHSGKKGPDKLYDGNGLHLRIQPTGSKQWVWQGTVHGRRREIGLGGYPIVSLRDAREKAFEFRKIARSGGDPREVIRKTKVPTFAEAAERCFALQRSSWKSEAHALRWWASLRDYALPKIGKIPVDVVSAQDVMSCLTAEWEAKPDTMRRVRQRISAVMRWAIAQDFRADNPAGEAIRGFLKAPSGKKHFRAVHYDKVPLALGAIRGSKAHPGTKLCLEFLVLTATRSGEARGTRWCEIDTKVRTWTIPADRTKTGREFRVPLSGPALEILTEAREFSDGSGLVFPSAMGKQLSDSTLSKLMRERGLDGTPHGFRSSFRDWCAEKNIERQVAEACLSHVVGGVEGAYLRSDFFELRRSVMDRWAAFVSRRLAVVGGEE